VRYCHHRVGGKKERKKEKNPLYSEITPGQKNVVHPALVAKSKNYLPPLHIKLHLIKIFVKVMDSESERLPVYGKCFPK
jgi:hypothetical protein